MSHNPEGDEQIVHEALLKDSRVTAVSVSESAFCRGDDLNEIGGSDGVKSIDVVDDDLLEDTNGVSGPEKDFRVGSGSEDDDVVLQVVKQRLVLHCPREGDNDLGVDVAEVEMTIAE